MPTTLTLTPLRGPIQTPLGEKPAHGRFYLALQRADREGDTSVAPHVVEIDLDADGDFTRAVWASQRGEEAQSYAAWVEWFSTTSNRLEKATLGYVSVPDAAEAFLADLWVTNAPAFVPADVLAQCVAAASAALTSANAAADDRDAAEQALADAVAVAASVTDQDFVDATLVGTGSTAVVTVPGLYPTKRNFLIDWSGVAQRPDDFTISVGSTSTTVTFGEAVPLGVICTLRVPKRLVTPVATAPANLTVSDSLTVNGSILTRWDVDDTAIDALIPGTNFGSLFLAQPNGHCVVALQENDGNDSFAIVSGGGNFSSDTTFDTLIALFASDGRVGIGTVPASGKKLHVGGAVQIDGAVTGVAVTQTPDDTTAGRLVKTGDYGLGGAIQLGAGDNLDSLTASGFYFNSSGANTTGNNYPLFSAGSVLNIRRTSTNWTQRFSSFSPNSLATQVRLFERSYGGSGWSPWVEIFHQGTILGTVSQSGGVPTGRLIQSAASGENRSERLASGTQEAWRNDLAAASVTTASGSRFRSSDVTWTFAQAFLTGSTPVVSLAAVDADCDVRVVSISATACVFRVISDVSKAGAVSVLGFAKGRWSSMT